MAYEPWLEKVHKERDLENQGKILEEMKYQNRLLEEQNRASRSSTYESGSSSSEGSWILGLLMMIGIVWFCFAKVSTTAGFIALGIIAGLIAIISIPVLAITAIALVVGTVIAMLFHFNDVLFILTWVVSAGIGIWIGLNR